MSDANKKPKKDKSSRPPLPRRQTELDRPVPSLGPRADSGRFASRSRKLPPRPHPSQNPPPRKPPSDRRPPPRAVPQWRGPTPTTPRAPGRPPPRARPPVKPPQGLMPRVSPPHGIRPGLKVRESTPAETQAVPIPQIDPGLEETAKDLRIAEDDFEAYEGTTYIEGSGAAVVDDEDSSDAPAFDEAPQPQVTLGLFCPLLSRRPFILVEDEVLRIGRHPEGGLCLPAAKVSRHHAEIRWDGHGFSIHDLGSTNGTLVNGRRIHRRRKLRAGMKLEIGPFSLEVREVDNPNEPVVLKPELGGEETRIDVSSELTGQLEEIGMGALIQFMKVTSKTGNLTLFNGHSVGQLWLEEGSVIHAEFGALYGLQAALALLGLSDGRFEFHSADITCPRTVHKPTQYLLMEAARLVDETSEPPEA